MRGICRDARRCRLLRRGGSGVILLALALAGWLAWSRAVAEQSAALLRGLDIAGRQVRLVLGRQDMVLAALQARLAGREWQKIAGNARVQGFAESLLAAAPMSAGLAAIAPDGSVALGEAGLARDLPRALPGGGTHGPAWLGVARSERGTRRLVLARPPPGGGVLAVALAPAALQQILAAIACRGTELTLAEADGTVLAGTHPGLGATGRLELPAGAAADRPAVLRQGRPLLDQRLRAVGWVDGYPLLLAHEAPPGLLRAAWARRMAGPASGAAGLLAVLLLLTGGAGMAADPAREAELRRLERLAMLAQLCLAVAHESNNLLQSIVASADALAEPGQPEEARSAAALILRVCERGMGLTRRLRVFGRAPELREGETEVAAALAMLQQRLAPELAPRHRLRLQPPGTPLRLPGHPADLLAALTNLVLTAREAMPEGGEVAIAAALQPAASPGPWARLTVSVGAAVPEDSLGMLLARGFARRRGGRFEASGGRLTLLLPLLPAQS